MLSSSRRLRAEADGGHVHRQPALGDALFQSLKVFRCGGGGREGLAAVAGEQPGELVAGSGDAVQGGVVAPVGPSAIETTDWPVQSFGGLGGSPGQSGEGGGVGGGLKERAAVHAAR